MDSLKELENFEKNKYDSEKKRSHNNFDSFLKLTIPNKLKSFDDLESDFEKAKFSINKSLSYANFGVIRDIKLITHTSKNRNNTISALLQNLSIKAKDTVGLYSKKSLFYHDIPKSVGNISDIQTILEDIKKVNNVIKIVERLITKLGKSYEIQKYKVSTTISVGVSISYNKYDKYKQMLHDADKAMYLAKSKGGNCFEILAWVKK